ncbi:PEPxxWA-CTERM sorting domain-containing protein [Rhizorhabdus argentea]|uniref:PEPxxWA-CTERM sorting domain-containing protein n=1 Tax=Rhizorhabdus argentea TaxID=1387174 RepID=UPI0030EC2269
MRNRLLTVLVALFVCAVGGPLQAANLLVNGDFEMISEDRSSIFGTDTNPDGSNEPFDGTPQVVTGWNTAGYNFVMRPGDADTVGATTPFPDPDDGSIPAQFSLWGPSNGSANGLTTSPTGGNFIAADGAYRNAPISQTLTGLTPGARYALTFYWAAAQQQGFNGDTNEGWTICFGTCSFNFSPSADGRASFTSGRLFTTSTVSNTSHGFVPWQLETTSFVATSSTQTLSLLAYGAPLGQPPFALIDGLNLERSISGVPEPSTWATVLIGFGLIGGVMRRRHAFSSRRPLCAQIV